MKQIGYIAPNSEMVKVAENVFEAGKNDVEMEIGNLYTGVEKAKKLVEKGVKVIIARGGTALLIRSVLKVPVIEIPITFEDIAESILKASMMGKNIAVVGYYNLSNGLKLLNPLLKVDLEQVYISNDTEIKMEILRLKEKGIDVIVGGELQYTFAREQKMNAVLLNSSSESIQHAYKEAETVLNTLLVERRRTEEIRAIIDHTKEGYIAVNKKGEITLINSTALELIPDYTGNPVGEPIRKVFPELENLLDVLHSRKEYIQDIASIGTTNILYDRIPITLDEEEIVGAIAAFQDINTIREKESKIRRKFFTKGLYAKYTLNDITGESRQIKNAIEYAKRFSCTDSTVLLIGNTGVGKELFAQGIHNMSNRKDGPFVGVNCASLPESILESELFGYEEGAFTGARKSGKVGLFELAHQGTIFLDEISEIPLTLQGRLLRVLQERQVMRLGSDKVIPIDVRIIAATNRNLVELVALNKFRDDLFFRLNVLSIYLPSLAERKEDIYILAKKILEEKSKNKNFIITESAIKVLNNYSWPGNVRELQNLMEKISIISASNIIDGEDIKILLREHEPLLSINSTDEMVPINKEVISKDKVIEVIEKANGNRERASKMLGVHRTTLWRWLKKYGIC